jgi:glycosyltransferase involved in cell wall biosynthesis
MRIAFHNVDFSSRSGPNAFCTRLARQLAIMGHDLVDPGDTCDVDLVNIASPSTQKRGRRRILRLDGIWTRPGDGPRNAPIQEEHAAVDAIVWQSAYDRRISEATFGSHRGFIIQNGASCERTCDTSTVAGIRRLADVVFCASASWHPQKRLRACIDAMRAYAMNVKRSACIIVLGRTQRTICGPDVFYCNDLDELGCRTVYEASDAMLHMAWRDHCPNACVEALAVGTPVVCTSSGGTPELVDATCGVIIDDTLDRTIDPLTFDYDDPPLIDVNVPFMLPARGSFDVERFSIVTAARAYEAAMLEVLAT